MADEGKVLRWYLFLLPPPHPLEKILRPLPPKRTRVLIDTNAYPCHGKRL